MRWWVTLPSCQLLFPKNNERLLGTEMKKFILLLLVLSLLVLPGCKLIKGDNQEEQGPDASGVYEIAKRSAPTKIITDVNYVTNVGDSLSGYYVTSTDGTNVIFDYYYEKLATPEESIASGNFSRILPVDGVIYYKDGVYYGDEEKWKPGTGTAFDLKFNVDENLLKNVTLNEDATELTAKISPENLVAFIGTDLNAVGDATVTITTNGYNLTMLAVACSTANGQLSIRTSYTYNVQELFPEEDVTEEENTQNTESAE